MKTINPKQKVFDLIEQHPQTFKVFSKHGCPDMRQGFYSFMARIMSIRNAARIHRIPIKELVNDLEESISEAQ